MNYAQSVFDAARSNGIPVDLANIIVGQLRHETADFTSNVFKSCLNATGYKYAGQAGAYQCVKSPEGDYYSGYSSVSKSVAELVAWIRRRQKEGKFPADLSTITTPLQYAQLLKNAGYYGASVDSYTAGIKRYLTAYKVAAISLSGVLVIGTLVYLLSRKRKTR